MGLDSAWAAVPLSLTPCPPSRFFFLPPPYCQHPSLFPSHASACHLPAPNSVHIAALERGTTPFAAIWAPCTIARNRQLPSPVIRNSLNPGDWGWNIFALNGLMCAMAGCAAATAGFGEGDDLAGAVLLHGCLTRAPA